MAPKCINIDLTVDDRHFDQLPIAPLTNQFTNHEFAKQVKIEFTYETATNPAAQVKVAMRLMPAVNVVLQPITLVRLACQSCPSLVSG